MKDETDNPHVKALGRKLNNVSEGMVLNFAFNSWNTSCKKSDEARRRCIEVIAVHEFGHAAGLAHEQNRPEITQPNSNFGCADVRQGTAGDGVVGPFDPDSIMSYCNPKWNNEGLLSFLDVETLKRIYGGTPRIAEMGWPSDPSAMADVTGDGTKDFCRTVGDSPKRFISCAILDLNPVDPIVGHSFTTIRGMDFGYPDLPRYFADVNGDRRADFCRIVGGSPNKFLACNLAESDGFSTDINSFSSPRDVGFDWGYAWMRNMADVNGDGRADYCRVVGDAPEQFLSCTLAEANGFKAGAHHFTSVKRLDYGWESLPRSMVDINRDGFADFCRYVGDKPNISLSCVLSTGTNFDTNQHGYREAPNPRAYYNL